MRSIVQSSTWRAGWILLALVVALIPISCADNENDNSGHIPDSGSAQDGNVNSVDFIVVPEGDDTVTGSGSGEVSSVDVPDVTKDGDLMIEPEHFYTKDGDQALHTLEYFVIYGAGFDKDDLDVTLGGADVWIQKTTDDSIEAIAPGALPSGTYPLTISGGGELVSMQVDYTMLLYATVDQPQENFKVYALDRTAKTFVPYNDPLDGFTLDNSVMAVNGGNVGQIGIDAFWGQVFVNRPNLNLITVLDGSNFNAIGTIAVADDIEAIAATPYDIKFLSYCERFLVVGDRTNNNVDFYDVKSPWARLISKNVPTGASAPVEIAIDRSNKNVFVACEGVIGGNDPNIAIYQIKSNTQVDDVTKIHIIPKSGSAPKVEGHYVSVAVDPVGGKKDPNHPVYPNQYPQGLVFFTNNSERFLYILDAKTLENVPTTGDITTLAGEVWGLTRNLSGIDLSDVFPKTPASTMASIGPMATTPLEVHLVVRVSSDAQRAYVYDVNDDGVTEVPFSINLPRMVVIDTVNFTKVKVESPFDNKLFIRGLVSPFGYSELYAIGQDFEGNYGRLRGDYLFELNATTGKIPGPVGLTIFPVSQPLQGISVNLRDLR
jgi:hypothetical protein